MLRHLSEATVQRARVGRGWFNRRPKVNDKSGTEILFSNNSLDEHQTDSSEIDTSEDSEELIDDLENVSIGCGTNHLSSSISPAENGSCQFSIVQRVQAGSDDNDASINWQPYFES